jgi:hypothetical protein
LRRSLAVAAMMTIKKHALLADYEIHQPFACWAGYQSSECTSHFAGGMFKRKSTAIAFFQRP